MSNGEGAGEALPGSEDSSDGYGEYGEDDFEPPPLSAPARKAGGAGDDSGDAGDDHRASQDNLIQDLMESFNLLENDSPASPVGIEAASPQPPAADRFSDVEEDTEEKDDAVLSLPLDLVPKSKPEPDIDRALELDLDTENTTQALEVDEYEGGREIA